jgi:hypothetical protein
MNRKILISKIVVICAVLLISISCTKNDRETTVAIKDNQFYINGEITYKDRYWQGNKIEGLLLNSRMVQGIFDNKTPATRENFAYPDTKNWDPDRNTNEFVEHMEDWYNNGLLAITLNLQGGLPGNGILGGAAGTEVVPGGQSPASGAPGAGPWGVRIAYNNTTFDSIGDLKPDYINRLVRILDKADELGMIVILGYFYGSQVQYLKDEAALIHAVDNMTNWILDSNYKNILVEICNESNPGYNKEILRPERVAELIKRVQKIEKDGRHLLVSTSFFGASRDNPAGTLPPADVIIASDYVLLHGNGMKQKDVIPLVEAVRKTEGYTSKPILYNEDDQYNFQVDTCNLVNAIKAYASWGYYDSRRNGEGFKDGYQSVPIDWGINSERKIVFFNRVKEITGK